MDLISVKCQYKMQLRDRLGLSMTPDEKKFVMDEWEKKVKLRHEIKDQIRKKTGRF